MKNNALSNGFPRNAVVSACCAPSPICVMVTPSGFYLKSPILRARCTLTAGAIYRVGTLNFSVTPSVITRWRPSISLKRLDYLWKIT